VMSAGGGWITNRESVALLRQTGRIIYLRASPGQLISRLESTRVRRPLLEGPDPVGALTSLYEVRRPLYEEADLILEAEVVEKKELIQQVREYALSL